VACTVQGSVFALGVTRSLALLGAEGGGQIDVEAEDRRCCFDAANVFEAGGCELSLSCYAGDHEAGEEGESRHCSPGEGYE
jgi:hypothetical protein